MTSERALNYLIDQHKNCQKTLELHTSPGNFRPGIAEVLIKRLASLDMAIAAFALKGQHHDK